ncbi:MAG: protein translocase subunit SecD [Sphingomonas sp.]|uniref:protein translocase subunit SecD n=1 Tax=Sphingomonas sp. TaxID=28214 RepID=UPI001ACE3405|nr:protein translocase subunit SecD [Sphingomonas sp.]MBN8806661.1 protein translocase subunit SecD [Sphingomonas sp.]
MLDFPRWKVWSIVAVLVALCALAVPSFFSEDQTKGWPVHPRINLGLDLAGGSYLLLEANTDDLIKTLVNNKAQDVINEMRRAPAIKTGTVSTDGGKVSFMLQNVGQLEDARQRLLSITGGGAGMTGQRVWDIAVVNSSTFVLTPTKAGTDQLIKDAMNSATEVVRTRIDKLGTREPTIQQQGGNRIIVQVPGLKDPAALKELLGKTAKLEFKMVDERPYTPGMVVPPDDEVLPYKEGPPGSKILVQRQAVITGDQLTSAKQAYKQEDNSPIVDFSFDSVGGKKFAQVTQVNIGRRFAVVVDGEVISAPRINSAILGGSGYIEGSFTVASANTLAIALSSGKLTVPLKVVEESSVGPDLGKDSINAGIKASIIAVVLVVLFMLATYGRFGIYADWAVVINVLVIMGVLAVINGTLTLPGIAGFVLTIGTAVDANVLINERIREERRRGRSVIQSVELGYKEASRTIFEANMTHAISGVIMFLLGSGPVKGFAVVLLIGIATSVFTAVTFTRMLVVLWLRKNRPQTINI